MRNRFFETTFTPGVQAEQARHGSREAYERVTTRHAGEKSGPALTDREGRFIAARDSFYLATVSETGWPHVQHRGGPLGFVRVCGQESLAWADYSGNRQYVSIGNATTNDKVAMIFMDYPGRQRLKVLGRMTSLEVIDRPELAEIFEPRGYDATIEHVLQVKVEAFDWNCSRHITPRVTAEEVKNLLAPLRRQAEDLQARLDEALAAGSWREAGKRN